MIRELLVRSSRRTVSLLPRSRARALPCAASFVALAALAIGCGDGGASDNRASASEGTASASLRVVQADFDGDGRLDTAVGVTGEEVVASAGAGRVLVLFGDDRGVGATPHVLAPPAGLGSSEAAGFGAQLSTGDFDGDGRAELAVVLAADGASAGGGRRALVYAADGQNVGAPVERTLPAEATSSAALDVPDTLAPLALTPDPIPFEEMTALQKHASYFDGNKDGWVTFRETFQGCRALGIGPISSTSLALTINAALGWPTARTLVPTLNIRIRDIDRGKHGSDTDIYDTEGRFVPERFESWFAVWDRNGDGGLDPAELAARLYEERDLFDIAGTVASTGEFGLLFLISAENGKISKESMRAQYDGTLFYLIAARGGARTFLP